MQPPKLTKHDAELVITKEAWLNLILGFPALSLFAICLFSHESTKPYFKENKFATIAVIVFFSTLLFFLIRGSLDQSIKMVINSHGIWVFKRGLLPWNNIHYYYFDEIKSDGEVLPLMKIKLLNIYNEIEVNMTWFNCSTQDIEKAIQKNSDGRNIIALKEFY